MTDVESMVARHPQSKVPLPRTLNNLPVVEAFAPPAERERIAAFDAELTDAVRSTNVDSKRTPLQKLALSLIALNFGDMMAFSKGTEGDAQKVWDWAVGFLEAEVKKEPASNG
jgi:hypothetical protein